MTSQEVLEFAKKNDARQVDLRFTDLPGLSQHISYPIAMLEEQSFEDGFGIDGSSIRGWAAINESDMLIIPDPPTDHYQDLRSEMVATMIECGLTIECHHHEVASGGQCEIDQKFDTLVKSADNMTVYKYIVRNVANQYGKTVTFMPKPLFGDNGSGMHTHQSLWRGGKPLFAGDGYAGLSQMALWYIGGLIKDGPALSAIISPTTNSY